jgi:hypothetical protein
MTCRFVRRLDLLTRRAGAALLSGVVSLCSTSVSAQPAAGPVAEAVELTWEAPANCPQRHVAQQRIRALAGPALRGAEPLKADGRIVFVNRRYRLTLRVHEQGQLRERTIESASCADLAGAAAVALGLLLRQRSTTEPARPAPGPQQPASTIGTEGSTPHPKPDVAPPPTPPTPPTAATTPVPETRPTPDERETQPDSNDPAPPASEDAPEDTPEDTAPSPERAWKFVVRAPVGSIDVGPLPKPGLGVGGALGLRWNAWSVMGGARIISAQTWLAPRSEVGAEVGRWQAEAALCRGWRAGRLEFAPCLSAGVERIGARGTGPNLTAQSQHSLVFVLGAGGAARLYVFDNLAIFAAAGLSFQTARPRLVIAGLGEVGHVGPVQLSAAFGPEWSF